MELSKVCLVTFSPTHTSKRIGKAIVNGIGCENVTLVDLTVQGANVVLDSDTLCLFTVPVYGGHVPALALQRMKMVTGKGGPAVVVVVYGNRAYEKALTELDRYVTEKGFKVIAGGTFVGEHSYSTEQYPIAAGRPDSADLQYAKSFGEKIKEKMAMAESYEKLYGVDVRRIVRPKQPFLPLLGFLGQIIKLRKKNVPMLQTPQVDESKCTHCGTCAVCCPTGAIVKGDECHTAPDKCIRCCACVKSCMQHARTFDTPFAPLLSKYFSKQKDNHIIL